jgi:two-component system, OmpR family, KDP operon response regulator KdpE
LAMTGPQILIIDDEPQICRALRIGLSAHGYEVRIAASGEDGLDLAAVTVPDAVILDLMLPGLSGLEVCGELRGWSQVPILVLSARGEERLKVEALDLGADDYLTKPFGRNELLARLRAILRRTAGESPSPVLECDELQMDTVRHLVMLSGQPVHLTPTEYNVLHYLMASAGKVVTHQMLLRAVWGPAHEDASSTLRVFVAQLRRKIEPDPARPRYIRTEPGIGYRFRTEP